MDPGYKVAFDDLGALGRELAEVGYLFGQIATTKAIILNTEVSWGKWPLFAGDAYPTFENARQDVLDCSGAIAHVGDAMVDVLKIVVRGYHVAEDMATYADKADPNFPRETSNFISHLIHDASRPPDGGVLDISGSAQIGLVDLPGLGMSALAGGLVGGGIAILTKLGLARESLMGIAKTAWALPIILFIDALYVDSNICDPDPFLYAQSRWQNIANAAGEVHKRVSSLTPSRYEWEGVAASAFWDFVQFKLMKAINDFIDLANRMAKLCGRIAASINDYLEQVWYAYEFTAVFLAATLLPPIGGSFSLVLMICGAYAGWQGKNLYHAQRDFHQHISDIKEIDNVANALVVECKGGAGKLGLSNDFDQKKDTIKFGDWHRVGG